MSNQSIIEENKEEEQPIQLETKDNHKRGLKRIQNTDGKKPKDYSFMIAELIPAWTADAIHFRTEKEILCGYHDPKVKGDQV